MSAAVDKVKGLMAPVDAASAAGDERTGLARRLFGEKHPPARIQAPRLIFIACVLLLVSIGLVMVYSSSSITGLEKYEVGHTYFFKMQAIYAAAGLVACIFFAAVPYTKWYGSRWLIAITVFVVATLLLTLVVGKTTNGATRWLSLGGFKFMPSEPAKVAMIVVGGALQVRLVEKQIDAQRYIFAVAIAIVLPLVLIVSQPDMGTTTIAGVGFLAVLWLGGFPKKLFVVLVIAALAIGIALVFAASYRRARLGQSDGTESYQIANSLNALGSGGLFGLGLGNSRQKYMYLPEEHTDFIFAVIGEELGFVGCLVVILLFLLLLGSGLRIARNAADLYGRIIAGSASVLICFQAYLNVYQTINLFAVTGKPMPFVSYGGTSLIAMFILVGLVMSVSLHSGEGAYDVRRDNLHVLGGGEGGRDSLGGRADWANRGRAAGDARASGYDDGADNVRVLERPASSSRRSARADAADRGRIVEFDGDARREGRRSTDARGSSQDAGERYGRRSSRRR